MIDAGQAIEKVRQGPTGPQIGAFFDLDGTPRAGLYAAAFYSDRLRSRQVSSGEFLRIGLSALDTGFGGDPTKFGGAAFMGLRGRTADMLSELGERLFVQKVRSRPESVEVGPNTASSSFGSCPRWSDSHGPARPGGWRPIGGPGRCDAVADRPCCRGSASPVPADRNSPRPPTRACIVRIHVAIARAFAAHGADVLVTDISPAAPLDFDRDAGGAMSTVEYDVRGTPIPAILLDHQADILVNNVGHYLRPTPKPTPPTFELYVRKEYVKQAVAKIGLFFEKHL